MSDRSRGSLYAVLLTVVLLLAGCSGVLAPDQQSNTPQPSVETFTYPSGWSQAGSTDLTVALRTHDDTVANVSRTSRLVITDADSNRTTVRTVDTDAGTGSIRFIDTALGIDIYTYYSADGVFEYDWMTEELSRMPNETWTTTDVATQPGLDRPLRNLELTATNTVTVDGTTAVRYTVTGIRNPESVPSNTATGHVTISEDGFIAAYDVTGGNDEFTRRTRYDLSAFGNATVTRPQ